MLPSTKVVPRQEVEQQMHSIEPRSLEFLVKERALQQVRWWSRNERCMSMSDVSWWYRVRGMEMGATWRGRAWTCSADGDLYEHAGIAIPLGQGHNRATVVFNAKRAHIHGVVRGAWHWSCKHCDARSTEIGGAYNCTGHSVNECRVSTQMSRKKSDSVPCPSRDKCLLLIWVVDCGEVTVLNRFREATATGAKLRGAGIWSNSLETPSITH